ncbi:hypothetical protein NP590_19575 [Methylomonas sp. SURF-2]|uniref:Uncharacterized protein n=1 Tax=Methylomonas subterranea TaxID=2952225 RepID=A0ABT1TLI3_9GAMM|nr:hypothetical protein [Methylomonas sp. SURF-2]MCQ8106313.1 hypothetical protein [Methylomonas sp. SURF-2]
MLSVIAAALVDVWFYGTAGRSGRPPVSWGVSGVVVYFLAALLWSLTVTPSVKDAATHNQNGALIFIVRYAYVGVGLAAAAALNFWLNKGSN